MENKINIAKLLKDCPKGMELDCTVFDNVTFDYVNTEQNRIYCKIDKRDTVWFTAKGCINLAPSAKCVIFPKGKTSWEGFIPPIKFKDGDIVATNSGLQVFILQRAKSNTKGYCYIGYDFEFNEFFDADEWEFERLATEEEKQRLFDAIKDNGCKWNAEEKKLEKLIEPKFKVGDKITDKNKFIYRITEITDKGYKLHDLKTTFITFEEADLYFVKVVDIFDINSLIPFESKVLVRDYINQVWIPTFWGKRIEDDSNCSYLTTNGFYKYCIPYKGNEHLLGTSDDCDDFYKTWE